MNALNLTFTENVPQTKPAVNGYPELDSFLNILRSLIREPSVVGCEDSFFRVLSRELEEIGVEVQYYYGVLVAQGSKPHDLNPLCTYSLSSIEAVIRILLSYVD